MLEVGGHAIPRSDMYIERDRRIRCTSAATAPAIAIALPAQWQVVAFAIEDASPISFGSRDYAR
jgi:hypothetical protein